MTPSRPSVPALDAKRCAWLRWLLLAFWPLFAACLFAQAAAPPVSVWDGHVVWVLPFANESAQPGVDWIGASFPDLMNQRLTSAGFLTIRREDRRYALGHLGLPVDFRPTMATTYRIAQTLDADYVIFGKYKIANGSITATARVLDMHGPRMGAGLEEHGDLNQLIRIENGLAWKVAMQMEPSLNLDEQTFLAAGNDLRLDAFENYIRGEVEPGFQEQISHLTKAVQLSPNYTQAWLALGKAYFASQQYEQAIAPLDKVPNGSRYSLEARFYAGLSNLYIGDYSKAQTQFSLIASVLPMPEVLNNEGIAINRRGQNGTALFQRVVQLNPQNPNYWFNLAVSERRTKDYAGALQAVGHCLALRPQDEEAQGLRKNLLMLRDAPPEAQTVSATRNSGTTATETVKGGDDEASPAQTASSAAPVSAGADGPPVAQKNSPDNTDSDSQDYEPLERIARSYDESAFRQAAFAMEQMNAMKLQSMPAPQRASVLAKQGDAYVREGLLLEAQRQFRLALASDPENASAYAGLAEVHEYADSTQQARQEADKSLQIEPNVQAYLVLARIALAQHSLQDAQQNVDRALTLDPKNSAAKGIEQAIQSQQGK